MTADERLREALYDCRGCVPVHNRGYQPINEVSFT